MHRLILIMSMIAALTGCVTNDYDPLEFNGERERRLTIKHLKDMATPCKKNKRVCQRFLGHRNFTFHISDFSIGQIPLSVDAPIAGNWSFSLIKPMNGINLSCATFSKESRKYHIRGYYQFITADISSIRDLPGGNLHLFLKNCKLKDLPDEYRKPHPSSFVLPEGLQR